MTRTRGIAKRLGIGAFAIAVGVTGCSAIYNVATSPHEQSGGSLAPSGRFVNAGGVLTHYERFGARGSPIVLVGGFLEPSDVWDGVARELAGNHRVFAMDLAGFGYSQRSGHYRLGDWQRQLDAFMGALGIHRALLAGHSLGAGVVAAQALAHPGRTVGIVLVDGDALASGGGPGFLRDLIVDPYRTSVFRIVLGWDWAMRELIRRVYAPDPVRIDAGELARWRRPLHVDGTEGALATMISNGIQGLEIDDLARVHVPATVVFGQHDGSVPVASGWRVAEVLHAPVKIVPGAGHLSLITHPRAVAAAIADAAHG
ncbi:MAG TPA: alpha/beta hydrolase [Gaiellales bacterium]|nr:alpha/beta hydrolase [Gaiellales bacterium]